MVLGIRETQIKNTRRYHFTQTRMAGIKRDGKCLKEDVEN